MPEITAIEPQKKKKGRFNVFIDGRFAFGADEATLAKSRLQIGQKIAESQLEKLIKETALGKLTDQALRFLSFRPRSEKEVVDYLIKKISQTANVNYYQARQSPQVAKVVDKLKRYNYINDFEFAKWWVGSRTKSKPKGKLLIRLELIKKGVDKETIQKVFSKYPSEAQLAKVAIAKKMKSYLQLPDSQFKRKIYTYLARRGFSQDAIRQTLAFLPKNR